MLIEEYPTLRMPAIAQRRPVYPRPRRFLAAMLIARIACLLILLAILAVSGLLYFATLSSIGLFGAKPTPTVAPCARVTLINNGTALVREIDEVCR